MTTKSQRQLLRVLADTQAFVLGTQVNRAFATVTPENLIAEAIARNGDTDLSNSTQYDPYAVDFFSEEAPEDPPAGSQALSASVRSVSGTDVNRPTKMDQLLALKTALSDVVDQIKATPLSELEGAETDLEDERDSILVAADFGGEG